eukprot:697441_1
MSAISLKASGYHRESNTNHNSVSRPFKRPRLLETPKKSAKGEPSKSDTALDQVYPGPSYDVELSLQTPIEMKAVDTQSRNTSCIQFKSPPASTSSAQVRSVPMVNTFSRKSLHNFSSSSQSP